MFGNDNSTNKIKKGIIDSLGIILVTLISTVYLFKGFFEPSWSDIPLWVRLLDAIISIVVAVSIQSSLGLQAIINGMKLEENQDLRREHTETIEEANDYADVADEWSEGVNKEALRSERVKVLSRGGLRYVDYFDEEGVYNGKLIDKPEGKYFSPMLKQYRKRVRTLNKALKVNIAYITFEAISASDNDNTTVNDLGMTPMKFHAKRTTKKFAGKVIWVAILSQIAWKLIIGKGAGEQLFNGAIQITLFLLVGGIDYFINWLYITETHPTNMRRKINYAKNLISFGKNKRGEKQWQEKMNKDEPEILKV